MSVLLDLFQNLPAHLQIWATDYGSGLYLILFLIIFAETGLVVAPLLPGDSLLFATGALLSMGIPGLELWIMIPLLWLAALCGDVVNYHVGQWIAPKLFNSYNARWLNRKHLDRTKEFYQKHGGKTVILARFIPIVRTYAPFVAGLGGMKLSTFLLFSVSGGLLWIGSFTSLGYFFGNIPAVKSNFQYVILAIIAVSVMPVAYEFFRHRKSVA
jgi:membrane-associated protein